MLEPANDRLHRQLIVSIVGRQFDLVRNRGEELIEKQEESQLPPNRALRTWRNRRTMKTQVIVHMIDGTDCWIHVPAERMSDNKFLLLPHNEFDPEDTSQLLEYLPGDTVRLGEDGEIVAARLSSDPERAYWALLYDVVAGKQIRATAAQQAMIRKRLNDEISHETRWHYPPVKEWASRER